MERGPAGGGKVRFSLIRLSGPFGLVLCYHWPVLRTAGSFLSFLSFLSYRLYFKPTLPPLSTSGQLFVRFSHIQSLGFNERNERSPALTHLRAVGFGPRLYFESYERNEINERRAPARLLGRVTGVPVPGSVIHWETNHIHPHNAIGAGLPLDNIPRRQC